MRKNNLYLAEKWNKFSKYSSRLNKLLKSGEFKTLTSQKQHMLISRLKRLYFQLKDYIPEVQLKKSLAAAATLILGLFMSNTSSAQISFDPGQVNPFSFTSGGYLLSPAFADLDNDGDLDMLAGYYGYPGTFMYYKNTGTSTVPTFAAPLSSPFGLMPLATTYLPQPIFADIDDDGDFDLFVGFDYYGSIAYYQNTGTPTAPAFAAVQTNPFGLSGTYYSTIAFADMDGDGDLDAVIGEYYGNISYLKNIGSKTNPSFGPAQSNPFGFTPPQDIYLAIPELVDLDKDGDFDLFLSDYYGNTIYYQNTGSATNPAFTAPVSNPFGLTSSAYFATIRFADIDSDGDKDAFYGEALGTLRYFKNTTPGVGIATPELIGFDVYPNPAKEKINIILPENIVGVIQIFDLKGQLVRRQDVSNKTSVEIELDNVAKGSYILILNSSKGILSTKTFVLD